MDLDGTLHDSGIESEWPALPEERGLAARDRREVVRLVDLPRAAFAHERHAAVAADEHRAARPVRLRRGAPPRAAYG